MKNILMMFVVLLLAFPAYFAGCFSGAKGEVIDESKRPIIDESKRPIMEDTRKVKIEPVVDESTDRWVRKNASGISGTLIKKYFYDDNTFVIICKGYPKGGTMDTASKGTAREAALLNAQVLAKETFSSKVDVITRGTIEKYMDFKGFAVIYYVIKYPGLKRYEK